MAEVEGGMRKTWDSSDKRRRMTTRGLVGCDCSGNEQARVKGEGGKSLGCAGRGGRVGQQAEDGACTFPSDEWG